MKIFLIFIFAGLLAQMAVAEDPPPTTTSAPPTTAPLPAAVLKGFGACNLKRKNTRPTTSQLIRDVKVYSGCY